MRVFEPLSRQRRSPEEVLQVVAEGTAALIGENFFRALAQHLACALDVRYCLLSERLEGHAKRVSTLAFWDGEGFIENFDYNLEKTPCHEVLAGKACIYRQKVRTLFPEDEHLEELRVESYAGVPFRDSAGDVIGHLSLLDTEPLDHRGLDLSLLKLFAARAGAELERQRATSALEASEARLRQIIDLVPHFIFAKDCEGRFILVNQAVADVFGTTVEELIDRPEVDVARSEQEAQDFRADDLEVIARGEPKVIPEEQITDADGNVHYLQTTKIPFTCANSELPSVLGVAVDITDRKNAEAERRKLDEQMRQAQKLESLGVLAGGIAHDFNNVLAGILGNAKLALTKLPPDSELRRYLESVESSARRAAELSNQMLAYSGRGRFVVQRIDLARVIEDMLDLLMASISRKATVRLDLASDLPAIEADVTEIRQVILNLVTNAADALVDSEGEVTVRARTVEARRGYLAETYLDDGLPEGRYVALEVADNGCGMDDETRARIFDPFFTTKFSGRGLGLAAVLGIVRGHSGAIDIETEPGTGTTFRVLFPATEAPAEEVAMREPHSAIHGGGRTVLVVDDDPTVRQVAQAILEHFGFEVRCAENGHSALEDVRKASEIAVVLLDMTMPHLDGIETLSALRQERPGIAVVLTSGYSEQEAIRRLKGQQPVAFIQKPFVPGDLGRVIHQAIEGARSLSTHGG